MTNGRLELHSAGCTGMRVSLAAWFFLLAALSLWSQPGEQWQPESRMVDVGGFKLHISTAGTGSPAVVFESGIGDSSQSWSGLAPKVAEYTRVILYDRAGLGQSETSTAARTFQQMTEELHRLVRASGIPGPYVLVGHSLGGGIIRTYAASYPQEVAGLVLVDPFTEVVFRNNAEAVAQDRKAQEASLKNAAAGEKAEFKDLFVDIDRGFPNLLPPRVSPGTPVALLVARQDRPPKWEQSVLDAYLPLVLSSADGSLTITPHSGHYIHRAEPDLVLEAIRRVVFPHPNNVIERVIETSGVAAAVRRAREMKQRYPADLFSERMLNSAGYDQLYHQGWREMGVNNARNAIELFKLNVELYPASGNVYDSLAEACAAAGDRTAALLNYRKSLELDPKNRNAAEQIKKLEQAPMSQ
jgi:pimeloyl-ACP methyl ester carboxylesterase